MPDTIAPSTTEPAIPSTEAQPTTAPASPSPSLDDDLGFDGGRATDIDEAEIFTALDETPEAPAPVAPTPPAPAQPQAQPQQPQQPAAPVEPAAHPAPEVTPAQAIESFRQWRAQAEHVLSNSHYNLSQQDADALNVDPGQVIPKLMSRVYLDAVTAAVNVISQSIPYAVMNTIEAHNGYQRNEDEFFGEWPGLKEHGGEVVRVGQVYRQLNPKASKADFIRSVGAQVAMALGLTADQARGTKAPAPNGAGQRVLRHVPPAASARHMAQPARPANFFEQLSQDTEED